MKVYILLISDRHCDTTVEVFASPQAAIDQANEIVAKYGQPGSTPSMIPGWLHHVTYSGEGDYVRVEEKEVQV